MAKSHTEVYHPIAYNDGGSRSTGLERTKLLTYTELNKKQYKSNNH